jgi:hypothetical protein
VLFDAVDEPQAARAAAVAASTAILSTPEGYARVRRPTLGDLRRGGRVADRRGSYSSRRRSQSTPGPAFRNDR